MMEFVSGLAHGFATLLSPLVLAAWALGLVSGIVAGFLPCLSPAGALALQAPVAGLMVLSFDVQSPAAFVVAFAYGTLYGRAVSAINQSAPDKADGPTLPKGGRRSLFAILAASIVVLAVVGLCLGGFRRAVLQFGPAEMVALIAFLLLGGAAFGRGSAASALAMVVLGLLLGLVGTDVETGEARLMFGINALDDGLGGTSVALGLFVIANVIDDLARKWSNQSPTAVAPARAGYGAWPAAIFAVLAGFLPTNGSTFATTVSTARSRPAGSMFDPARQGSATDTLRAAMLSDIRLSVSLIPVFLLLLPVDAVTPFLRNIVNAQAMIMGGGNVMANLTPIAWLVFAALILAHIVPLIIVLRLSAVRWRPIAIDTRIVALLLVAAACLASWQLYDEFVAAHICIMLAFGLVGYAMIRAGFDRSLMFFAFVIALRFEENIRRSLLISRGDITTFMQRPISASLLLAAVLLFVVARTLRARRVI